MLILLWYMLMIWLAICGLIAIVCLYIALWTVAVFAAVMMIGLRAARGQGGEQLWRKPFTPQLRIKIPARIPQAHYSNRR